MGKVTLQKSVTPAWFYTSNNLSMCVCFFSIGVYAKQKPRAEELSCLAIQKAVFALKIHTVTA